MSAHRGPRSLWRLWAGTLPAPSKAGWPLPAGLVSASFASPSVWPLPHAVLSYGDAPLWTQGPKMTRDDCLRTVNSVTSAETLCHTCRLRAVGHGHVFRGPPFNPLQGGVELAPL